MMDRVTFLQSLSGLREFLKSDSPVLADAIQRAFATNPWFIPEFSRMALTAIADEFLDERKCGEWMASYPASSCEGKRIALIMAGNVPVVGFHDLLCVLASGHKALIKMSDKDPHLLPVITDHWIKLLPFLSSSIQYIDRLEGFDAMIATGSNNSARYFEYYFKSYPHILRQNRNGVAVLTGDESLDDLEALARDIFLFFGSGCRNVSKLFVPEGYDFTIWNDMMAEWFYLADHNKYKNNLDYNYTIYLINKIPHIHFGPLILKEDEAIASRIGCVHYSYYQDKKSLEDLLLDKQEEIQCVISLMPVNGWEHIPFGESQTPQLDQFADGVNTMQFLSSL